MAAVFLVFGITAEAQAGQKVTGSGQGFYVPKTTTTYKLADGRSVQQASSAGTLTAAQPDNALNMNSQDCDGTTVLSADGKTGTGSGYCVNFDKDGDAAWMWWRGDLTGGTWGFVDGTGKFKGVDGGGTWKTARQWPDGKFVNSWEGTWQTK
jgi:hypothetical protein